MRGTRLIQICGVILLSMFLIGLNPLFLNAQEQADSLKKDQEEALKIFIDTPDYFIDFDYVRTEITFVNYVRDRTDADVHILITTQRTGGGGIEFTLAFIGLKKFEGQKNTLKHVSRQTDTDDDIRRGLIKIIKIGLMQYAAHTPVIERLTITYKEPEGEKAAAPKVTDPWNYWTFRTSIRGSFNGEKSYKYDYISGSISASRTTEAWKIYLYINGSYQENQYKYGDQFSYTDIRRNYDMSGSVIKSLSNHWSIGTSASTGASTYRNVDIASSISPGIEFSVFPYAESTRRFLTFIYRLSTRYVDYIEETIYLKSRETLFSHSLSLSYDMKQPWGSIYASIEGAEYLHDLNLYHIYMFNSLDIRIFKGLSLNLYGSISFLRDQISLSRSGATLEEVLLKRRQLETSYNYWLSLGFSYTFGSIYNNIVNPRFGGSGGGRIFHF